VECRLSDAGNCHKIFDILRRALSVFVDVRDAIQKAYDRAVERANAIDNHIDPRVLTAA
jgi:hypothetical protein